MSKLQQQLLITQSPEHPIAPKPTIAKKVRAMRKDSTVAFAREIAFAPIITAAWSVQETKKAPSGAASFIDDAVQPLRDQFLRKTSMGCFDFGWQPFELELDLEVNAWKVLRLRGLLQDITEVCITKDGYFDGYKQRDADGNDIFLPAAACIHITRSQEGDNLHGTSIMEAIEPAYDDWCDAAQSSRRYDRKIAGTHLVVRYPAGTTPRNGVDVDNFDLAKEIADMFESNGRLVAPHGDEWKVELLGGQSASGFAERMRYLDALKVRGARLPERAVLEGQYGTKAEADAHGDFAILAMQLQHAEYVGQFNKQLVDRLLRWNFGPEAEGTVYVEPAPLTDESLSFLRTVFTTYAASQFGALEVVDSVDWAAIMDRLGLPMSKEELNTPDTSGYRDQTNPSPESSDGNQPGGQRTGPEATA